MPNVGLGYLYENNPIKLQKKKTELYQTQETIPVQQPKNKKYFQGPFLVLQLVTNRGLVSVSGRTDQCLEEPTSTLKDHDRNISCPSRPQYMNSMKPVIP